MPITCAFDVIPSSGDGVSVRADSCDAQTDGSCVLTDPRASRPQFSAHLLLSDDAQGGDFFFAQSDMSVQVIARSVRII